MSARTALAVVVALVLWSSAFAAIREALGIGRPGPGAYSPGALALLRFLVASATLGAYFAFVPLGWPQRRHWPGIVALGLVGIGVYHVSLNYGEITVTAGVASLITNTSPVFTALLATAFMGERLRGWGWAGTLLSFCGVALIAQTRGQGLRVEPGALWILLASLCASVYFVFQKPLLQAYGALRLTAYAIFAGTALLLPFAPELARQLPAASAGATLSVVYLGIFPAATAYFAWSYVLARTPASRASSFLYLSPALAYLIAWAWRGSSERPTASAIAGGVLIIVGVAIVNSWGRPVSTKDPSP